LDAPEKRIGESGPRKRGPRRAAREKTNVTLAAGQMAVGAVEMQQREERMDHRRGTASARVPSIPPLNNQRMALPKGLTACQATDFLVTPNPGCTMGPSSNTGIIPGCV
jgi:hypothetical protein